MVRKKKTCRMCILSGVCFELDSILRQGGKLKVCNEYIDKSEYSKLENEKIFLVWSVTDVGSDIPWVSLRAVDETRWQAELHRKTIELNGLSGREKVKDIFIEERLSNHIFGEMDMRLAYLLKRGKRKERL